MTAGTRGDRWTADRIGTQQDRVAVVTGATAGIGYETALALARAGATVVLACRDLDRAATAAARIADHAPGAQLTRTRLDLADLASVRAAAAEIAERHPRIDLLINNAGRMWAPRSLTQDGFESQFGTNHLGHFALTGLLLPRLTPVPGSRVVTVSSMAHSRDVMDLADLDWRRRPYKPMDAYAQSKLANVLFSYELQRRLAAAGAPTIALAVHPGIVRTELVRHMRAPLRLVAGVVTRFGGQPDAARGALATLRAATDPDLRGGEYLSPDRRGGAVGSPVVARSSPRSYDEELQRRLWQASAELTGVDHPV
jgi:NAD(P)-dependent dehydrogenase (short-subunit alcohol dehydrogenase family)